VTRTSKGLLIAGVLVLALIWGYGFKLFAEHDKPAVIDHAVVVEASQKACAALGREVDAVPSGGPRAEVIKAEDQAIGRFVDRVKAVGQDELDGDRPAQRWLRDWHAIVVAREGDGVVPMADGAPITQRMSAVGITCTIPERILDDLRLPDAS
jgi:hypothetical protein